MAKSRGQDIRIEYPSLGRTYYYEAYGVYEYSRYPRDSVLAGQQCRRCIASYDTLAEATAAYPGIKVSDPGFSY
jgi:hypothetical protein